MKQGIVEKLLVLGSDTSTLEVVKEAHKNGIYVIVTDLMATSPTKQAADESWHISTTETDLLIEKCRENNVTCIMFGASDFNVNCARKICKRLHLPIYCEDDYAWRVARDKREFKDICIQEGAPVAKDYYVSEELTEEELSKIQFPVVVKPIDRSGNKGMSYCHNREELVKAYEYARSVSDNSVIIVERMLIGTELHAQFAMAEGEARLVWFSSGHHQDGEEANLYSFSCDTTSHLRVFLNEVLEPLKNVFKRIHCTDGITWVDMMYDNDGHIYLLEMGYRFAGVMLYRPLEVACGFNSIKWMLDVSRGIKHTRKDLPKARVEHMDCCASYNLFAKRDGKIDKIEGLDELENMPNVFVDMPKREGDSIRYHACMGLIGIYAMDYEELSNILQIINAKLQVKNAESEDMIIYFESIESVKKEYEIGQREFAETTDFV